jgi:hypothetical protein
VDVLAIARQGSSQAAAPFPSSSILGEIAAAPDQRLQCAGQSPPLSAAATSACRASVTLPAGADTTTATGCGCSSASRMPMTRRNSAGAGQAGAPELVNGA